ncbi:MAG: hypothetical protein GKS00_09865 [Alphaproteobacteria bacterium]|nr:hypothetical protein [Alphaproteobacteria bacterium]
MEIEQNSPAVTTPTTGAAGSLSSLAANFDTFLNILTTQLQHQDPLDPLDSNEFTSQLVEFTGVEQQVLQNKNLESLIALQEQNQSTSAVAYIGKVVEASGNTNMLANGEAIFSYILPETGAAAVMQVFDSSGDLVFQQPVDAEAGIHDIVWDGTTTQGGIAADGAYSFRVTAANENDEPIEVQHRIIGRVTGVSFDNDKTILGIGEIGVPLDVITGVQDAPEDAEQSEQG